MMSKIASSNNSNNSSNSQIRSKEEIQSDIIEAMKQKNYEWQADLEDEWEEWLEINGETETLYYGDSD